jgi:hypothetical protein
VEFCIFIPLSWILYFFNIVPLSAAIITLFFPLLIIAPWYLEKKEHQIHLTKITKTIYILGGIFVLGGIFWFTLQFVGKFIVGSFQTETIEFWIWALFSISFSYGVGGFIMYLVGKKRNWRPPKRFIMEIEAQFKEEGENKILIKTSAGNELWIQKTNLYSDYENNTQITQTFLINQWELYNTKSK